MKSCTFFGHCDCTDKIQNKLTIVLKDLILNKNIDTFYIGNNGRYDELVRATLLKLRNEYQNITCYTVLAFLPTKQKDINKEEPFLTLYPEELEKVPKRFAILHRNRWMVQQADIVVAYVTHPGGVAQAVTYAEKRRKEIIRLADSV